MNKDSEIKDETGYLAIGQVLRPQGLRGEVKVRPDTDDPARFLQLSRVYEKSADAFLPLEVKNVSIRKGMVYLTLGEDATVEAAEVRRGLMLYIDRAHAVPLGEYENYIADLIGCQLVDTQGQPIGKLKDILQPGANDIYVVDTPEGELLIPALRHVILDVNTQEKIITVDEMRLIEVAVLAD
ncbi:MAG: ribosome maturation factor RimM [Christensenellales bacterium]